MTLVITSTAYASGGAIPALYTCEGRDISPPLAWSGAPPGTKNLTPIVDDPDAPDPAAPAMTWVHWVVYNIPPTAGGLLEAVKPESLPPGTQAGINDWGRTGYGGRAPPVGRHRYFQKLYALDMVLRKLTRPDKQALETAMGARARAGNARRYVPEAPLTEGLKGHNISKVAGRRRVGTMR